MRLSALCPKSHKNRADVASGGQAAAVRSPDRRDLAANYAASVAVSEVVNVLRPPSIVMQPDRLGATRLTRFSFNRSLLRRAFNARWRVERTHLDLDAAGRGQTVYRVDAEGHVFHFVAFTTTLDESQHTDRVVADVWEISAALVETHDGILTEEHLADLAVAVPRQEAARLDARVLVLTRGNRSVRFFDTIVEALSAGRQPDPHQVGDAGYIMRSTAFYGNGKFGMRSFGGDAEDHPLCVPYRAQMLAAWLFRELSYDVVEHCARMIGGETAVGFDDEWRRYFGLGNATGLGLVPYAMKHPRVLHAWSVVRETALANVRQEKSGAVPIAALRDWLDRAERHFAVMGDDNRAPWKHPVQLSAAVAQIRDALATCSNDARPFDSLCRWADSIDVETSELVVSLVLELDDSVDDDQLDRMLLADESVTVQPSMTVNELRRLIDQRYEWLDDLDLDSAGARHYWWVVSDNTDEPRRVRRDLVPPEHREVAVDVAIRVWQLRTALDEVLAAGEGDTLSVGRLLVDRPELGAAVKRVVGNDVAYGEPRSNACAADFLPLDLQRFQLAMYGMDNFSPKSTDWLRVTLNQGAPRLADLNGHADEFADDWVLPSRPSAHEEDDT